MKLAWVKYQGGIEMRDDDYTLYNDYRYCMCKTPDGSLIKYTNINEAKRNIERVN